MIFLKISTPSSETAEVAAEVNLRKTKLRWHFKNYLLQCRVVISSILIILESGKYNLFPCFYVYRIMET